MTTNYIKLKDVDAFLLKQSIQNGKEFAFDEAERSVQGHIDRLGMTPKEKAIIDGLAHLTGEYPIDAEDMLKSLGALAEGADGAKSEPFHFGLIPARVGTTTMTINLHNAYKTTFSQSHLSPPNTSPIRPLRANTQDRSLTTFHDFANMDNNNGDANNNPTPASDAPADKRVAGAEVATSLPSFADKRACDTDGNMAHTDRVLAQIDEQVEKQTKVLREAKADAERREKELKAELDKLRAENERLNRAPKGGLSFAEVERREKELREELKADAERREDKIEKRCDQRLAGAAAFHLSLACGMRDHVLPTAGTLENFLLKNEQQINQNGAKVTISRPRNQRERPPLKAVFDVIPGTKDDMERKQMTDKIRNTYMQDNTTKTIVPFKAMTETTKFCEACGQSLVDFWGKRGLELETEVSDDSPRLKRMKSH